MGFAGGLGVGAMRAAYAEELNFAPAIAAFAGNAALVGAGFHLSREMTRLVRQRDDWINSCVGGAVAGSAVATAFRGRAYSPAGARPPSPPSPPRGTSRWTRTRA